MVFFKPFKNPFRLLINSVTYKHTPSLVVNRKHFGFRMRSQASFGVARRFECCDHGQTLLRSNGSEGRGF